MVHSDDVVVALRFDELFKLVALVAASLVALIAVVLLLCRLAFLFLALVLDYALLNLMPNPEMDMLLYVLS